MRTIEAYQKGGFASLVLEGKQAFVERYAFGSAFWQHAHRRGCAGSGGAAQVQPEGSRRVLPRAGAEEQEGRGLRGRGALVSRDARLVPAGRRSAGDALPARPKCCSSPADLPRRRANTSALPTTIRCTRSPRPPATRRSFAYQKHEPTHQRRVEGAVASTGHRERADVRDQLPGASRVGARADQGGRRAVRAERVRSRDRSVASRSSSATRRSIAKLPAHGGHAARALAVRSRPLR